MDKRLLSLLQQKVDLYKQNGTHWYLCAKALWHLLFSLEPKNSYLQFSEVEFEAPTNVEDLS